jgi:transposase-like protein
LTVFAFPAARRRRLRTNNGLERLSKEIKRRTRVATLFPNEPSRLRLVSAVVSEISDDWEIGRSYLTSPGPLTRQARSNLVQFRSLLLDATHP